MTTWAPGMSYGSEATATRKAETKRKNAMHRVEMHRATILDLELKLQIQRTWTPLDEEYTTIEHYLQRREFYQCLSKLQGLVVQRLFELQKARVPGMSTSVFSLQTSFLHFAYRLQCSTKCLEPPQLSEQGDTNGLGEVQRTRRQTTSTGTGARLESGNGPHICFRV